MGGVGPHAGGASGARGGARLAIVPRGSDACSLKGASEITPSTHSGEIRNMGDAASYTGGYPGYEKNERSDLWTSIPGHPTLRR